MYPWVTDVDPEDLAAIAGRFVSGIGIFQAVRTVSLRWEEQDSCCEQVELIGLRRFQLCAPHGSWRALDLCEVLSFVGPGILPVSRASCLADLGRSLCRFQLVMSPRRHIRPVEGFRFEPSGSARYGFPSLAAPVLQRSVCRLAGESISVKTILSISKNGHEKSYPQ